MGQSDLRHRLIAELKQISSELGYVPTRDEYRKHSKIGEKSYRGIFGGWTPFVIAAGLKTYSEQKDKNSAFIASIGSIKFNTGTRKPILSVGNKKILCIGDAHFPWVHKGALDAIYQYIRVNPDITDVVQLGDLYDMYSWAKFPRSHMLYTPKAEIELGRAMAEEMWVTIRGMLPNSRCYQITGNHDVRPIKKVMELAPEMEVFIEFSKWFEFAGVKTVTDPREWLEIGNVSFTHGHLSTPGAHAKSFDRNVVCGHSHKGSVQYLHKRDGNTLFELNCGYIGDPLSRPMSYTATKQVNWTLGFGVIDQWGPRFIAL